MNSSITITLHYIRKLFIVDCVKVTSRTTMATQFYNNVWVGLLNKLTLWGQATGSRRGMASHRKSFVSHMLKCAIFHIKPMHYH